MRNLAVFFFFLCCLRVEAHVGDVVYPIFELTDADLAQLDLNDGSIADWELLLGTPTLTRDDAFRSPPNCASCVAEALPAPEDLDFAIWLGWHQRSNRLYFAAERFDDVTLFTGAGFFIDDNFELRIDGDHQGDTHVDWAYITHCHTSWTDDCDPNSRVDHLAQTYYVFPSNLDDWTVYWSDWDPGSWVSRPPYADGSLQIDTSASPTSWVTEFYVTPFDSLIYHDPFGSRVSLLSAGKVIGFDVAIFDGDDASDGSYDYSYDYFSLSGDYDAYYHAHFFVDGLLVGKVSPTPVERSTWGRIKATFVR